ncbi:MAG: hypothetical protein ACXWPM_04090 [Bdellovibrionota bacterium]
MVSKILLSALLAMSLSACGARQYNGRLTKTSAVKFPPAMGPFYANGMGANNALGANTMSTPGGGCASLTGRPCARLRASVGVPFQFDINPNTAQAPVAAGATFAAPGTAYAGTASTMGDATGKGAGKTNTARVGVENRDLHLMKGQTAPGEQAF